MPYKDPKQAFKLYRPSNGTEGDMFVEMHCQHCKHFMPDPADGPTCNIYLRTMIHEKDEPNYPKEWIHDCEGEPICTKFEAGAR